VTVTVSVALNIKLSLTYLVESSISSSDGARFLKVGDGVHERLQAFHNHRTHESGGEAAGRPQKNFEIGLVEKQFPAVLMAS